MTIEILDKDFAICSLNNLKNLYILDKFTFVSVTDDEISLVCTEDKAPLNAIKTVKGWKGFRIKGILEFSLKGIIAEISDILAKKDIGVFAVSTYNTDYFFVKNKDFEKALAALRSSGHDLTKR